MINRFFSLIITMIVLLTPLKLNAENGISGKIIKNTVENILSQNKVAAIPVINEKKIYPNCNNQLNVRPTLGDWKTITVECAGKHSWKIVIRNKFVSTSNQIKILDKTNPKLTLGNQNSHNKVKVAAIKRSIRRGDVITPSDVVEISIPEYNATDIFPNYKDLIGRRAKTTIRALTPVYSRQLETNFLIKQDMQVTISYQGKHISVQMEGIALENGQYGDWINVKNTKSGKVILAKVVAEKKVTV